MDAADTSAVDLDGAPRYFVNFFTHFNAQATANQAAITDLTGRVTALETRIDTLNTAQQTAIANVRADLTSLSRTMVVRDDCEVLLSGVPAHFEANPLDAAARVFCALGFPNLASTQVLGLRPWINSRAPTKPSTSQDDQQASPPTFTFVVKLASPTVRDAVMRKAPELRSIDMRPVLNVQENCSIYVNQLYPKPVFDLLRKARAACQELGYVRPIAEKNIVYVRETRDHEWIPIYSEATQNQPLHS